METIPEMKIEGLEEALERFRALSGEIDRLTESARTATTFCEICTSSLDFLF